MPLERSDQPSSRGRVWIGSAAIFLALLLLPIVGLFLLPSRRVHPSPRGAEIVASQAGSTPTGPRRTVPARTSPARSGPSAETPPDDPVQGLVVDPDGKPVGGAAVRCGEDGQRFEATTDEQGRFTLAPAAAGCQAVASQGTFQPADRTALLAGRINILRLRQAGMIEGDVVDERGRPVTSYLLAIESFVPVSGTKGPTPGGSRTFDDPAGAFSWGGLAPGSYVLTASATGRPPAHSAPAEVEIGRPTRNVRIVLPKGALLSGRVFDADTKRGIRAATIALDAVTATPANAIGAAQSDENGNFTLDGVPPGPFSVRVTHGSYRSRILAGLTTRGQPTLRQDIDLRPVGDGGAREEYSGIGAVLAPSPRGVIVNSVITGGPAERGGLLAGDRLVRIDGADATTRPMTDCIQLLRGPEGSIVTLRVERDGREVEASLVRKLLER